MAYPNIELFPSKLHTLRHLLEKPINSLANQGTLAHRPGTNHAWTCKLNGYFLKAVDENAPLNVRNLKDHSIQNMLGLLQRKGILPVDIQFPRTLLTLKNIGPVGITALKTKQKVLQKQLKQIEVAIKVILREDLTESETALLVQQYNSLENLKTKIKSHYVVNSSSDDDLFDHLILLEANLTKKIRQLGTTLEVNTGIEKKINPKNKNKKRIVFVMEDVEMMAKKPKIKLSRNNDPLEATLTKLNNWLRENLGLYHWDCKNGRNTIIENNQTFLIDPAFTVEDPKYKERFNQLLA
jgi:hypothetical protein